MAIDENLAAAVRTVLQDENAGTHREVKMFGGIGFMLNGNFVAGASSRGLLVRVGRDQQSKALSRTGAQPMIMGGRTMADYIRVAPDALDTRAVRTWVRMGVAYVRTLAPQGSKTARPKQRRQT